MAPIVFILTTAILILTIFCVILDATKSTHQATEYREPYYIQHLKFDTSQSSVPVEANCLDEKKAKMPLVLEIL